VEFDHAGGRPVLDLVGTLSDRGSADVERLRSWPDVESWVRAAGIAVDDLRGDDADLDRVRELREALYAVVTAQLTGGPTGDRDRRLVNTAARATLVPELTGTGAVRWTGGLGGLLGAVARDALDLLSSDDLAALRQCADPHCTRLFVDRSRGGRRRWCGMKGCGDRAKAAAYRRRHRETSPAGRA
jgi:predicted RNA-binding Zn ribbon-like protein